MTAAANDTAQREPRRGPRMICHDPDQEEPVFDARLDAWYRTGAMIEAYQALVRDDPVSVTIDGKRVPLTPEAVRRAARAGQDKD